MAISDILQLEKMKQDIGYNPSDVGGGMEAGASSFLKTVLGEIDRRRKLKETEAAQEFQLKKLDKMLAVREKGIEAGITKAGAGYGMRTLNIIDTSGKRPDRKISVWDKSDQVKTYNSLTGQSGKDDELTNIHRLFTQYLSIFNNIKKDYMSGDPEYQSAKQNLVNITDEYAKALGEKTGKKIDLTEVTTILETTTPEQTGWQKFLGTKPEPITTEKKEIVKKTGGKTQSPGGTIRVKVKATGDTGTIPENEFDDKIYEKI